MTAWTNTEFVRPTPVLMYCRPCERFFFAKVTATFATRGCPECRKFCSIYAAHCLHCDGWQAEHADWVICLFSPTKFYPLIATHRPQARYAWEKGLTE